MANASSSPRVHRNAPLGPTGHIDNFARENLPPPELWPDFLLDLPQFRYPEWLNAGVELSDRLVELGHGDRIALIGAGRRRTYRELSAWTNQLARALVEDYGVKPGNRVLVRSANTPAFVAVWIAATKAGAVVVNTMPMLRAGELTQIIDKAQISLALTDSRIAGELEQAASTSAYLKRVVHFDGAETHNAELDRAALGKPSDYTGPKTGRDDVALIAFTSGTTGKPKATMHFHRDILIMADSYAKEVLQITPEDIAVGSPPLAFTFGLGGLAAFPLRFGAASVLLENASPADLVQHVKNFGATLVFTAPTAYRAMLAIEGAAQALSKLRIAISAGETLPAPVFIDWREKTGVPIINGIGSTEMIHTFIANRLHDARPGATGVPVTGYEARIVDDDMNDLPPGEPGKLAVRGPSGCRYLADERQKVYVRDGWNLTGDTFTCDEEGIYRFVARADDMIISAGYNIAGPEVEAALLAHPAVAECAVIGAPDEERGEIVEAHVVTKAGVAASPELARALQDHVKATLAPYKYPRSVKFAEALPKTTTGKIQRFALRADARK